MLDFGRETCSDLNESASREWLVTNGLGGYACGTVAGVLTRKYHGLLVAATDPPRRRMLLLAALDAEVTVEDAVVPLACHRWASGVIAPEGHLHLERFRLERSTPVWTYAVGAVRLERRLWMRRHENTTCVRHRLLDGGPVRLRLKALDACRSHHAVSPQGAPAPAIEHVPGGLRIAPPGGVVWFLQSDRGQLTSAAGDLYRDYFLAVERERGYDAIDAHRHVATLEVELARGDSVTIAAGLTAQPAVDGDAWLAEEEARQQALLERAAAVRASGGTASAPATAVRTPAKPRRTAKPKETAAPGRASRTKAGASGVAAPAGPVMADHGASTTAALAAEARARLVLAADQFIVVRRLPTGAAGASIIAGYPWFEDWGRDAMISLPGLCLATGRHEDAKAVLRAFAAAIDQGMLPNRFPDEGGAAEYHTADATLWFVEAAARTLEATSDVAFLKELWPKLEEIVDWHERGTRFGIGVDSADGLLHAGQPGLQLTWMDAKVGDWVVTPRIGKPVEINALWCSLLRRMAEFAERLGRPSKAFADQARRVQASFDRFWNNDTGCLYDVLDGPDGHDPSIRPNQIFAAALPRSPLSPQRQQAVVARCAELATSLGLRTLSPHDRRYRGRYHGDQRTRDAAYHQGTVWPWLIGAFVDASRRCGADESAVQEMLAPLWLHLKAAGLGSVSEVADGDAPHRPDGCFAQAWSVAELLRVSMAPSGDDR